MSQFFGLLKTAQQSLGEEEEQIDPETNYPADAKSVTDFPGVDPKGKYSRQEMELYDRMEKLKSRSSLLPNLQYQAVQRLTSPGNAITLAGLRDVQKRSLQMRRLDRMLQLANQYAAEEDADFDEVKKIIQEQQMGLMNTEPTPNMHALENVLTGLEIIAGLNPPVSKERENMSEDIAALTGVTTDVMSVPLKLEGGKRVNAGVSGRAV